MSNTKDEILEQLYLHEEQDEEFSADDLPAETRSLLDELASSGLVKMNDAVTLTPDGRARAEQIIRLHRLAERLFEDVFDLSRSSAEEGACTFEHCLNTDVAESICTLLGHPRTCPHGKAIPMGECCRRNEHDVEPIVMPLADLPTGKYARVMYIGTKHHERLDRLSSMGVLPGAHIRLHQRRPSYVIQLGETTLALDKAIAKDIYVMRCS